MWGADSVTNTPVYPCDNGDCTYVSTVYKFPSMLGKVLADNVSQQQYGQFLDRVIADLKANNMLRGMQIDIWVSLFTANIWRTAY
jgi:hypothetical protein